MEEIDGITYLDGSEICEILSISRRTLQRRIRAGQFPAPTLFERRAYWPKRLVDVSQTQVMEPSGNGFYEIEPAPRIYPLRDELPAPRRGGWDLG